MAVGDYVVRSNASNTDAIPDAGSDLLLLWDTADANTGSGITYSAGTFTLGETGHFLVIASDQYGTTDTTNNERINAKTTFTLGSTELQEGFSTGYIRKSGGSQEFNNASMAVINVTSTTGTADELQVRTERIDNSTTGTTNRIALKSGVTIIKLDDTWGYGRYESSAAFTPSATDNVYNVANLGTTLEEDSPFTRTGNVVDIATNNLVLAIYSFKNDDTDTISGRTEMQGCLELAGTVVPGSYSQTYGPRATDNSIWGGMSGMCLLEPTSGDDLELQLVGREDIDEDWFASIQLIELPSGAEACIVESTSVNQASFNNGNEYFNWDTNPYIDTAAFTHTVTSSDIDVDNDGDYLVMASQADLTGTSAATRAVPQLGFRVNAVEAPFGNSSYCRNSGTAEWPALNVGGLLPNLSATDSISAHNVRLGTVTNTIPCNSGAMSVVRLSSLFSAGPATITGDGSLISQVATMSGTAEVEQTGTGSLVSQDATMSGTGTAGVPVTTDVFTDNATVVNATADNQHTGFTRCTFLETSKDLQRHDRAYMDVDTSSGAIRYSVFKFADIVTNLPATAVISSATLYLNLRNTPSSSRTIQLNNIIESGVDCNNSSWNEYDRALSPGNWATGGGISVGSDIDNTYQETTLTGTTPATYINWDVTQWIKDIHDSTITYYGQHIQEDDALAEYISFSTLTDTEGTRPELVVEYTIPDDTVTGTGSLLSQDATMSGTGEVEQSGTGSLVSQSASMSGTGEVQQTGTGSLVSQSATMAGTAEIETTGSGSLISQSATMSGTAEVGQTGSGSLVSQSATMSGTAEVSHPGSGSLISQAATMSGVGEVEQTGTGSLISQSATMSGTGAVGAVITGTGSLLAQSAVMSGTGLIETTGSGSLTSQSATMSGTAEVVNTSSGSLISQSASMSGVAEVVKTSTGSLVAQSSTMSGTGAVGAVVTGTGSLVAQSATMSGVAEVELPGTGSLLAQSATMSGVGEIEKTSTGSLVSQSAAMSGTGTAFSDITGSGSLTSQSATMSGTGTSVSERTGTGSLVSQSASMSGTGEIINTAQGSLVSQPAQMSGTALITKKASGSLVSQSATMTGEAFIYVPKVECVLVSRAGDILPNLMQLSWAWFDHTDPVDFIAPSDTGETELTGGFGELSVNVPNTTLTTGQTGTLILRSNNGLSYAAYNLDII